MKPIFLFGLLASNIIFSQNSLQLADSLYAIRAEGSSKNIAKAFNIEEAIKYYYQSYDEKNTIEATVGLLKSQFFYGKYVVLDNDKKKRIFDEAVKFARKNIIKFPQSAAIRYWYLVNLGSWAEVFGIIAAAREGFADIMKSESEKIIELDSSYSDGGGYFMLGVVHLRAPYVPFVIPWPDKILAESLLEKARKTGNETLIQKVYYAKSLYKNNKKEKAIGLFTEVTTSLPSEANLVEDWEQILEAEDLLKNLK